MKKSREQSVAKIHPSLLVNNEENVSASSTIYEGENYKVIGPLIEKIKALGLLVADSKQILEELIEARSRIQEVMDSDPESKVIEIIVNNSQQDIAQALVNIPLANYVCLADLAKKKQNKKMAKEILKREMGRGYWEKELTLKDIWIDPQTKKTYILSIHKLK